MRIKSIKHFVFFYFVFICSQVFAGQFDNPYLGNVEVKNQNETLLKRAALEQVLVKVSGNKNIVSLEDTKLLIKDLHNLISQFGYKEIKETRYFYALFDKNKINRSLIEMRQAVWGKSRPSTLVWLLVDDLNAKELLSEQSLNSPRYKTILEPITKSQIDRGIALLFPLMDLDDSLAVSMLDISGGFHDQIAAGSDRYQVKNFVVANLRKNRNNTGSWNLNWKLVNSGDHNRSSIVLLSEKSNGNLTELLTSMTDKIADRYASKYAIVENIDEQLTQVISVDNISSLEELNKLNKILKKTQSIKTFKIISTKGRQLEILVEINGGIKSFNNTLSLQSRLKKDPTKGEYYFIWK